MSPEHLPDLGVGAAPPGCRPAASTGVSAPKSFSPPAWRGLALCSLESSRNDKVLTGVLTAGRPPQGPSLQPGSTLGPCHHHVCQGGDQPGQDSQVGPWTLSPTLSQWEVRRGCEDKGEVQGLAPSSQDPPVSLNPGGGGQPTTGGGHTWGSRFQEQAGSRSCTNFRRTPTETTVTTVGPGDCRQETLWGRGLRAAPSSARLEGLTTCRHYPQIQSD